MLNPQTLTPVRVKLHYAIQLIAVAGSAFIPPAEDYSHNTLMWDSEFKEFIGNAIEGNQLFYVALDPMTLIASILDSENTELASFSLNQKTLAEGIDWLKDEVSDLGLDPEKVALISYPEDFPDHPIAHGAKFDDSEPALREALANYYDATLPILETVRSHHPEASTVKIWPHHFDMATLIALPTPEGEEARSIGVGFSPGDASFNEPYWYVTPWPYPPAEKLPALETKGTWQTKGWVGTTLTASELGEIEPNRENLEAFITSAIGVFQELLNP